MQNLIDWLRGVLREDELAVIAAKRDDADNLWKHQRDREHHNYLIRFADPKTVLADIEAKKAVLDLYAEALTATPEMFQPDREDRHAAGTLVDGMQGGFELAVRALASAYQHRPGWKREWEV